MEQKKNKEQNITEQFLVLLMKKIEKIKSI